MAQLVDTFEAEHPGIRIVPRGVPTAEVLTTLRAETAAGSPPAVAQIGWSKMAEAYASLPVTAVQEIAPPDQWAEHTAGMAQNVLAAVADDGVVRAMPFGMSVPALFYNADLFRAAGLDPDRPPTTIAEVQAAALAIRATGNEGVYVAIADAGKSDYLTQSVVNSAGGALVDGDAVTVDSPEAVAGLTAVAALTATGAQPAIAAADAVAQFGGGRLGMLVVSTAVLGGLERSAEGVFELRATGFPRFGDGPARPTYSGAGLAVLTDDPREQAAAWEFIRFLTSDRGFTTLAETIGYLPLRPAVAGAADPRLAASLAQLEEVTPYTAFPGENANQAVVALQDEAVEPIVLRGADPSTTLRAVAERIRALTAS
ncbi:extracellular solute-binding protein [Pseudonocardia sp. KRD-169]|uniref:Extracellular solute-binding protein n=2 Tax=Pseudonocardia abyssalis TaxID=2792008 RepID=A0ABS6UL11_9PSEU|nr:extracellular solute-binding protein [Pseudonocardia abyssalis]MBW0132857.1 extracellular solute-binding protein [Pseudonocardia abyssalis]